MRKYYRCEDLVCDQCGKAETLTTPVDEMDTPRLWITTYEKADDSEEAHFCSWGCVIEYAKKCLDAEEK